MSHMASGIPKNFAGLPETMVLVLIQTGLPGIAWTLNIGQLVSTVLVHSLCISMQHLL